MQLGSCLRKGVNFKGSSTRGEIKGFNEFIKRVK